MTTMQRPGTAPAGQADPAGAAAHEQTRARYPDADGSVEMHGKPQFAGLIDHYAKDVVLKEAVIFSGRNTAGVIFGIDGLRFFARRIGKIESTKVGSFKLDGHAAAFLIVGHGVADEIFVAGEIGRQ